MNRLANILPKLNSISVLKNKITLTRVAVASYSSNEYKPIFHGVEDTKSFRIYYEKNNKPISPFHDIPLFSDKEKNVLNMIVEIPRFTHAKMEINKKEFLNPISQDSKKEKLRYINNVYPYYGYIWNYGALPQTYDDPNHIDETTGCIGDNDPLDVIEIGTEKQKRGSVIQVKVLGALGLIDEGEADWKIVAINTNDPLAEELADINDVETKVPGLLDSTRDWFKLYKIPTGKPANNFALNGKFFNKNFSYNVIRKSYDAWKSLSEQKENKKNISMVNTSLNNFATVSVENAQTILNNRFNELKNSIYKSEKNPEELEKVYYIDRSKY
ncbi:unnamed protein product [Brachionus calyciflorus]|uniref:inorganic diphosphatase n=1 Tax=Brachionus calyciflorus TaxID=104777 RepID=A0A813M7F4_9BILA|nr:unnamed protein product [Brachionus calyciflorus]